MDAMMDRGHGNHDDVIKWKHFPRCWPFVRGIHRSPVTGTKASDAKLWCFLWSAPEKTGWVNNLEAGDLRRHRAHYDVTVMIMITMTTWKITNYYKVHLNSFEKCTSRTHNICRKHIHDAIFWRDIALYCSRRNSFEPPPQSWFRLKTH